MNILRKLLITVSIFSLCLSFATFGSNEGMMSLWSGDNKSVWYYLTEDGTRLQNQWKQVWENWYYFGEDGVSKQNTWFQIEGRWYYFDQWSVMLHDTTTPDGYTVGSDGAWVRDGQVVIENVETNNNKQ